MIVSLLYWSREFPVFRKFKMGLKRYGIYTKKEVHDQLDPDSSFYYYCGKWGINGVIKFGLDADQFALFVTLGNDTAYNGIVQTINKDGRLKWCSPLRQGVNSKNTKRLLKSGRLNSGVYIFGRRNTDYNEAKEKTFVFLGMGQEPEILEEIEIPNVVSWKITSIDLDNPNVKRLMD